jgi:hypothetical protein
MCKRILAAVLIIGCIALSEFLMDDSGSLDESGYSAPALVGATGHTLPWQYRANPHGFTFPSFTSPSRSVCLVSTFHRQFRLHWLNHAFLI